MTATVTHKPKAGAKLTGAEYEAANHHVVSIAAADIGAAADDHDHDADYATTGHDHDADYEVAGAVASHAGAADPHTGYLQESDASWIDLTDGGETSLHSHAGGGLTHPQVLARGLGA